MIAFLAQRLHGTMESLLGLVILERNGEKAAEIGTYGTEWRRGQDTKIERHLCFHADAELATEHCRFNIKVAAWVRLDALRVCREIFLIVHGNLVAKSSVLQTRVACNACAMLLENPYFSISYRCMGARLRILDHCMLRSSLPTIPFSLEPMGSPPLLMRTHALSSNLTTLPSGRWYFLAVRTTTACLISPRRTLLAALMETLPPGPDSGPKLRCF